MSHHSLGPHPQQAVDELRSRITRDRDFYVLLVGAYGLMRPKVASAVVGVAIAVSLLPSLVATGVGLAPGGTTDGNDALVLFLLNVTGIFVASVVTFWLLGMRRSRGGV